MFNLIPLTETVALKSELKKDGIVIFQSSKLDLNPSPTGKKKRRRHCLKLDQWDGYTPLYLNKQWGKLETISLHGLFKNNNPTIMVYGHGNSFQILIDYHTVKYYTKRSPKTVTSLSYIINPEQVSPFSNPIAVNTYSSMAKLLATSD
ncbi:hypothetical protein CPB86DRAFT_814094 [Serendipita vermifera]|nr:hypothetical protein CPB86DRAFT_814094 [Serendipita vermifera]